MKSKFSHLCVHSDYSIVDGLCKPELFVKKALNLKMTCLALTDYNNLFGALKFYKVAWKFGVKPIIGLETKIFSNKFSGIFFKIILLAVNYQGYKNLIALISKAYEFRKFNKQFSLVFIKREWLTLHNKGLILLSGGQDSDIGYAVLKNNLSKAKKYIEYYKKNFFNNYYLGISRIGRLDEEKYIDLVLDFSFKEDVPIVAVNSVCFLEKDDFYAHTIRVCINQGVTINDRRLKNNYTNQQFFRSQEEMKSLFKDIPESLVNSVEISKRCNVILPKNGCFLPRFSSSLSKEKKILVAFAKKGMNNRLKDLYPEKRYREKEKKKYFERLKEEIRVINRVGFPGYFLVVMEFISWSKKNNIPVGPGRGSGAGSLVAYALRITDIEPISLGLLFERFLNSERVSMPDFDIDFCMDRRDEVIKHVESRYGEKLVAQIVTFGTLTAKAVIKDVGRVLGYPYGFVNSISKLIPLDPGTSLRLAIKSSRKLKNLTEKDSDVQRIIFVAKKLENVLKSIGKHAGGVVIAPKNIVEFSPLYCDEFGKSMITQFDKDDLEYVGLVKFDFLGLKTLTTINNALKMINKKRNIFKYKNININSISLREKKAFETLRKLSTVGIFQLESQGMKDLIDRLHPDSFEDLIALIALFRPGPLQSGMVENFINRKKGKEKISYPMKKCEHHLLQPILESTYGIILYQEQVMKIAQVLAGYTLSSADVLRRVIGKKKPLEMRKQRSIFIRGCQRRNFSYDFSKKIFSLLEKFAGYGFNKSHSAAYARISYQTLWLKTYYPSEYMAAVMSSEMDNSKKMGLLINEAKKMKIGIVAPSILDSKYNFYVNQKGKIVYGMGAIKGIGKVAIDAIIYSREKYNTFSSLFDLCIKVDFLRNNKKVLEKLIMSGALDVFGKDRLELLNILNYSIKSSIQYFSQKVLKQDSLFGSFIKDLKSGIKRELNKCSSSIYKKALCDYEFETLGLYLTVHPMNRYIKEVETYLKIVFPGYSLNSMKKTKSVILFGVVISIQHKITKNQKLFLNVVLDNGNDRIIVVIFSELLKRVRSIIVKYELLFVIGYIDLNFYNSAKQVVAKKVYTINLLREKCISYILIFLKEENTNVLFLKKVRDVLRSYNSGKVPILICYLENKKLEKLKLGEKWKVTPSDMLFLKLKKIVGRDNVKVKCKKIFH